MQHTLVAVFDNRTDAQSALNELMSSGFTGSDARLSNADPTGQTDSLTGSPTLDTERSADGDTGISASIKNFFSDLFGSDNAEHASRYEGAVTRGHHVLTVTANSLSEVERAADIVERYGPTDIDESSSGTPELGAGMSAGAMGLGAGAGLQQSASMSSQSSSVGSAQAASIPSLDNAGDRKIFQQQSLNQAEPMGTTYQEPQGTSGLSATGGTSLQGSTLRENSVQGSSLEGTMNSGASAGTGSLGGNAGSDSLQRDTALAGADTVGLGSTGSVSGSSSLNKQRSGTRIYSRERSDASANPTSGLAASSSTGMGIDDDSYFRQHFDSNYSAAGAKYDDYLPAYSYGSDMARNDRYTNRAWDDVETDLRSDWETRSASNGEPSTWEKMKNAVRAGWDRMTGDDDDAYYRNHHSANYEGSGALYEDVKPAYSYGSEMRKSEMYRDRPWDDVETDLRTGWDSRIDGRRDFSTTGSDSSEPSTWDRVKNAVRHGWDKMTDDDDVYNRQHFNSTYSSTGDTYETYSPAYAYGSSMARDDKYRGRQWDSVEADLRSDWDSRYATEGQASTWDKMKAAVRHGWDRMTNDDDDVYYRNHWNSVYGAGGDSYDSYRPAYTYGSSMARDDKYRGRDWTDVEGDLRNDWDTRYPGEQTTWDKMKSAVRAGWDRMMR